MNPYKTIWLAPKRTFEEFVLNNKRQPLFVLPILTLGLISALNLAPQLGALFGEDNFLWGLLIAVPVGIGTIFLAFGLLLPGLIMWVGRIWKGSATMRQLVNVWAISFIPFSSIIIYQLVLLVLGQEQTLGHVNEGVSYSLWLWSFSLLIIGVSKVQKFSYGMALLNVLMSYLPWLIIALLIA